MKGKILLGVVASMVVASNALAGEIVGPKVDLNMSQEWLDQNYINNSEANVTLEIDGSKIYYKPTNIPAGSLKNPVVNIVFTNAKAINLKSISKSEKDNNTTTDNLGICEAETSTSVLKFDHIDTDNHAYVFVSIDSSRQIGNSKKYYFCNTDDNTSVSIENAITLDPTKKDFDAEFKLYSGDSQELQDIAKGVSNVNIKNQLCATVTQKLSKKIDPATGFKAFAVSTSTTTSGCSTTTTTNTDNSDSLIVTLYDNKTGLSYTIKNYNLYEKITATASDGSILPIDSDNIKLSNSGSIINISNITPTINDNIIELYAPVNNTIGNEEANLTTQIAVNGNDVLKETNFVVDLGFDIGNNGKIDNDLEKNNYVKKGIDAGNWKYKGTLVSMPYVVANADTKTAIRLTNGQSVNAPVYWSCVDDEGKEVNNIKLNSADHKNEYVPANGASAWLATDILKAAQNQNPDFAQNGKMKCNALVTATSGVNGIVIQTINGGRDRVLPTSVVVQK